MRTHSHERAVGAPARSRQHLIEVLLPLYDNGGRRIDDCLHAQVKKELTERFGGLTAYSRAPAEGRWKADGNEVRDEVVIYEVVAPRLDRVWWKAFRKSLEERFHQDEVLVRAMAVHRL